MEIRGKDEGSPLGWCGLNQPWRRFWSHGNYCTLKAAGKTHLPSHFCQIPEASTHRRSRRSPTRFNFKTNSMQKHCLINKNKNTLTPTQTNPRSYMRGGSSARSAAEAVFIERALHATNIKHCMNWRLQSAVPEALCRQTALNHRLQIWTSVRQARSTTRPTSAAHNTRVSCDRFSSNSELLIKSSVPVTNKLAFTGVC